MSSTVRMLWGYVSGVVDRPLAASGLQVRAALERWQRLLGTNQPDFEAEGLLDGADDRKARVALLKQLFAAGVPMEDLRRAVEQDRLALLPVEAVLQAEGEHTLEQMASGSGLGEELLCRRISALGIGRPESDWVFNDDAISAARALKELEDAGIPDEGIDDICRTMGRALGSTAEAIREVFGEAFLYSGDSERDLGLRYAAAARQMLPVMEPLLEFTLTMHLLQLIRSDVVSRAERAAGTLPDTREVAVCFADLEDFTRLGERLSPEELGRLVRRFDALVQEKTPPGARHVKTIGDAAMLIAPEPEVLVDVASELIKAADGDGFPRIHAGIAAGPAVAREGDWHGRPVNLASRIAACAPAGAIYVTEEVREAVGNRYLWRGAGRRHLKGIDEAVALYCMNPATERAR
jgi:adenylate cyclase